MRIILVFLILFFSTNSFSSFKFFYQDGKVGLIDENNVIIIPAIYDDLGWSNGSKLPSQNFIGFKNDGLWGVLSLSNQQHIRNQYQVLYPSTSKGYFIAAKKKNNLLSFDFGIIKLNGKVVLPFRYSNIKLHGQFAIVSQKKQHQYRYGVLRIDQKKVINTVYKQIKYLGELKFAAFDFSDNCYLINQYGNIMKDTHFDSISSYVNDVAIVYKNNKVGLINLDGDWVTTKWYKSIIVNDFVHALEYDQWTVFKDKKLINHYYYDDIEPVLDAYYKVTANGKQWVIDKNGKKITSASFDEVLLLSKKLILFKLKNKWGLINDNKVIIEPRQDSIVCFNSMIATLKNSYWIFYDIYGNKINSRKYDNLAGIQENFVAVSSNHKWGFINELGKEIIHCVFQIVLPFKYNKSVVKLHDYFGIINKKGNWVVFPQKDTIILLNESHYLIYGKRLKTIKNFEGKTIYFTDNQIKVKNNYLLEYLNDGTIWKINYNGQIENFHVNNMNVQEIREISEGFIGVKIDGKYGFMDRENRLVVANRYEDIKTFGEGLVAIKLFDKWGVIDRYENLIIQPHFKSISNFRNGLVIVHDFEGFGLINKYGIKITKIKYQEMNRLPSGYFLIRHNNKLGLLDKFGKVLLNTKFEELEELDNGFFKVKLFEKYGVLTNLGIDYFPIIYDDIVYDLKNDEYLIMKKSVWKIISI